MHGVGSRRSWRVPMLILTMPVLLALLAGHVQVAGASSARPMAGNPWTVVPSADVSPTSADGLTDVSCPTSTFCASVGVSGSTPFVEIYRDRTWSITPFADTSPPTLASLDGVSCSSARFCMAVGDADASGLDGVGVKVPVAETWNGSSWRLIAAPTNPAASGFEVLDQLTAVSCPTARFCAVTVETEGVTFVDNEPTSAVTGYAGTWNGSGWSTTAIGNQPDAVSCARVSLCVAVGTEGGSAAGTLTLGGDAFAATWQGSSWSTTTFALPSGSNNGLSGSTLNAVSCVTSWCLATGTQQLWTEGPPGTFTAGPTTVVDAVLTGSSWSSTSVTTPPVAPAGLACTVAGTCVGVGQCSSSSCGSSGNALIERLGSGIWSPAVLSSPPATPSLASVSCGTRAHCTAVGDHSAPADRTLVATGKPVS
jgi:hypothetical protein